MIDIRRMAYTQLELTGAGIIDRHDVQRAGEALVQALLEGGRATLLLDLRAVEDMTMRALAQDASLGTRLRPLLPRLDRVALVGDADWAEPLSQLQRSSAPSLCVRRFDTTAIDQARAWLAGRAEQATRQESDATASTAHDRAGAASPASAEGLREAIDGGAKALEGLLGSVFEALDARSPGATAGARDERPVDQDGATGATRDAGTDPGTNTAGEVDSGARLDEQDGVLVLDLRGRITREDVERLAAHLDTLSKGGVAILARLGRFEGIDPAALTTPALWRLRNDGLSRLSRIALVTSVDWLRGVVESSAQLHRIQVRSFAPEDEALARAWLEAQRAVA